MIMATREPVIDIPKCGLQRDSANKGNISFPISVDILSWFAYERKPKGDFNENVVLVLSFPCVFLG